MPNPNPNPYPNPDPDPNPNSDSDPSPTFEQARLGLVQLDRAQSKLEEEEFVRGLEDSSFSKAKARADQVLSGKPAPPTGTDAAGPPPHAATSEASLPTPHASRAFSYDSSALPERATPADGSALQPLERLHDTPFSGAAAHDIYSSSAPSCRGRNGSAPGSLRNQPRLSPVEAPTKAP